MSVFITQPATGTPTATTVTLPYVVCNILANTSRDKYNDDDTADVVFLVDYDPSKKGRTKSARLGPKTFPAHKFVLPQNGFFETVLDHCKTTDGPIPITGVEPDVFQLILQHCYGIAVTSEAIEPICTQVINAADQLGVISLKTQAEILLVRNEPITMENVMDLLSYADAKNLEYLKEHTLRFLLRNARHARHNLTFAHVPGHLFKDLLGAYITLRLPILPDADYDERTADYEGSTANQFYYDALKQYNNKSTADIVFKVIEPAVIDLAEDGDDSIEEHSTWETTNEDAGRNETNFYVHRFVLPKKSAIFELANSNDTRFELANSNGRVNPVTIRGVKSTVFNYLLTYLYGGPIQDDLLRANAKEIIDAAVRFGVPQLRIQVEALMLTWVPKISYSDALYGPVVTPTNPGVHDLVNTNHHDLIHMARINGYLQGRRGYLMTNDNPLVEDTQGLPEFLTDHTNEVNSTSV